MVTSTSQARMAPMPTVHDVADYFLWLAHRDRLGVDHLKLQKLVYYAQGFHLGFRDRPLFEGELRAWAYGPVSPDLWQRYRYRRDYLEPPEAVDESVFTDDAREVITMVHERFRNDSGLHLYRRTHDERPWVTACEGDDDLIQNEVMAEFFRARLYELQTAEAPPPVPAATMQAYLASHPEVIEEARRGSEQLSARQ